MTWLDQGACKACLFLETECPRLFRLVYLPPAAPTEYFSTLGHLPNHGFSQVKENSFQKGTTGYSLTQLAWLSEKLGWSSSCSEVVEKKILQLENNSFAFNEHLLFPKILSEKDSKFEQKLRKCVFTFRIIRYVLSKAKLAQITFGQFQLHELFFLWIQRDFKLGNQISPRFKVHFCIFFV